MKCIIALLFYVAHDNGLCHLFKMQTWNWNDFHNVLSLKFRGQGQIRALV